MDPGPVAPDVPAPDVPAPRPGVVCAHCGEAIGPDDQFCEACGQPTGIPVDPTRPSAADDEEATESVHVPARTCHCGGTFQDGWCTSCGAPEGSVFDHTTEEPAPGVAGVSDRGIVHTTNQDAMATAAHPDGGRAVLVVCDGVSSTPGSDAAAQVAAVAARRILTTADPDTDGLPGGLAPPLARRVEAWSRRLAMAAEAAQVAAAACDHGSANPASCTFVAVVRDLDLVAAAWIGDSRAYWLSDVGPGMQLTTDHSWAAEQVAAGVPRDQAEADPRAHSVTRWLGADAPVGDPGFVSLALTEPGWLLVCSDGLWNYCSDPVAMGQLFATLRRRAGSGPLALAEAAVAWANDQGGHDNVTVALARIEGDLDL